MLGAEHHQLAGSIHAVKSWSMYHELGGCQQVAADALKSAILLCSAILFYSDPGRACLHQVAGRPQLHTSGWAGTGCLGASYLSWSDSLSANDMLVTGVCTPHAKVMCPAQRDVCGPPDANSQILDRGCGLCWGLHIGNLWCASSHAQLGHALHSRMGGCQLCGRAPPP